MKLAALAFAAALAFIAQPAAAQSGNGSGRCVITSRMSLLMQTVLSDDSIDIDNYNEVCQRLRNANMGVDVVDYGAITGDRMVAIVVLRLYDRASRVNGSQRIAEMMVDADLGEGSRERNLLAAYNNALNVIGADLERHIQGVHGEVGRLRTLYRDGVPTPMTGTPDDCRLTYMNSQDMNAAMNSWNWPGFEGSAGLCAVLQPEGAGLAMIGGRTQVADRAIGWVATGLFDRRTLVEGYAWAFTVNVSTLTTPEEQLHMQREAAVTSRQSVAANPQGVVPYLAEVREGNAAWFTGPGR